MGWRVWGEVLKTADYGGSSPVWYQPVVMNKDVILLGCRTSFIIYDDPTLTSIQMRVYSNNPATNTPKRLLETSTTTHTKAAITTLDNAVKQLYFEFSDFKLDGADTYHFVPWLNGYTGDDSSHVAWMKAFPDPILDEGLTLNGKYLGVFPYDFAFIGAEL